MRFIFLVVSFILSQSFAGQFQTSDQLVAHFAMQTIKSSKFKDLARNLFPFSVDRKEFADYIKKHELQNRSLPDVVVEGDTLTIKERSRSTTLDLSLLKEMKLVYNKTVIPITGRESYTDFYLTFLKLYKLDSHSGRMALFINEAFASPVVIAVVALSAYAKAAVAERIDQVGCPQSQKACEAMAQQIRAAQKNLVFQSCDSKSGVISFSTSEVFKGKLRKLQYALEVTPADRPTEVTWIKLKADEFQCQFQRTDTGLDFKFNPVCKLGKSILDDRDLKPEDFQTVVKYPSNYKDVLKCCGEPACARFLISPPKAEDSRQTASQSGTTRAGKFQKPTAYDKVKRRQ